MAFAFRQMLMLQQPRLQPAARARLNISASPQPSSCKTSFLLADVGVTVQSSCRWTGTWHRRRHLERGRRRAHGASGLQFPRLTCVEGIHYLLKQKSTRRWSCTLLQSAPYTWRTLTGVHSPKPSKHLKLQFKREALSVQLCQSWQHTEMLQGPG